MSSAPGAAILLVTNQNYVISSNAAVKLGGVPLKSGQIVIYVPQGAGNTNKVHIDDYTLSEQANRIGIGNLPFDGSVGLDFIYHRSQLSVHVKLPDVVGADPSGSDPITGAASVSTDNSHGLLLDSVDIRVRRRSSDRLRSTTCSLTTTGTATSGTSAPM